jgi:hypothetical protein
VSISGKYSSRKSVQRFCLHSPPRSELLFALIFITHA